MVALFVWFMSQSEPSWELYFFLSFYVFVALVLFVEQYTHIDANAGTVTREGRLFGRFRLWFRQHPLKEFTAVSTKRETDPGSQSDPVFVCLRRNSGQLIRIQYFSASAKQPCIEAERAAQSLAKTTGLPLIEEA